MKPCPRCGHPGGLVFCEKCHSTGHVWIDSMGDTLCELCGVLVWDDAASRPCPNRVRLSP